MNLIRLWWQRYFSDPQALILLFLLIGSLLIVLTMGDMLAPVFASIVIAYLLEGIVRQLISMNCSRLLASVISFTLFMVFYLLMLFWLLPLLSTQVSQLLQETPSMISASQKSLLELPAKYPALITENQIRELAVILRSEIGGTAQYILTKTLASVPGLLAMVVYLFLVPLLVFFFLKDKELISEWISGFLPKQRRLAVTVWTQVNSQIAKYVRGKVWEIIVVWSVTYAVFSLFGLHYAMLISVLIGLSVIIPYVGAVVVTIPVILIAFFQWGWEPQTGWLIVSYGVIQALDGNLLVPLLFSEVVNLHPIAIILAVLIFGGLWGFWGVFFAIPLATVVQVLLKVWPRHDVVDDTTA
ncbi:MAG: AI-2E family transporter [bacterium]|nr:MAG: AI-2E family transporter [bacterium]HEC27110.1 AI-2E family transporter [Gammaproteobacteria bacterium]